MSQRYIAETRRVSRASVSAVLKRSAELNLSFESLSEKTDDEVYDLFFPDKGKKSENFYTFPDYDKVHSELKRVGVTLKLLWQEYCDTTRTVGGIPVKYTKFCEDYAKYCNTKELTSHLTHKPGIRAEVDWSGKTMTIYPLDGKETKVFLFVGCLTYSQYSYAEPCTDMKENSWLRCNCNMYSFFGGVPRITVCDNLKTGVIAHPKEGDIVLNQNYESLGVHYQTAIMPARVRRPKDKATVEGTVGKLATFIIGALRNEKFTTLDALKRAVNARLNAFNNTPFQQKQGSRTSMWQEEKKYLKPLPLVPFEICEWRHKVKVGKNCHILFLHNYYSCHFSYRGEFVDVKSYDGKIEIYHNDRLVAVHIKFPDFKRNQYSTHKEDLPDFMNKPEFDEPRYRQWAQSIGPNMTIIVDRLFASVQFAEQAYNSVKSVLQLSKHVSTKTVEQACSMALEKIYLPRYKHLKAAITEVQEINEHQKTENKGNTASGFIRGDDFYNEEDR